MFATENKIKDGFEMIELRDKSTGTFVEIIPSCGGLLHSFNVDHNGGFVNVVDGYENKNDLEQNLTAKGFKSCKLSPFACRIKDATYSFEENTYLVDKFLLGPNALHGLIYDAVFTVIYQYANEEHAGVAVEYKYRGDHPGFPFDYDCVITYHLKRDNELLISTDIFNRGEGLMPIQDGWHPYFTFGKKIDDLQLKFKSNEKLMFDNKMIPTGRIVPYEEFITLKKIGDTIFDDCFTVNHSGKQPLIVLKDPEANLQVEVWPDKTYPYVQFYTPGHRMSLAIECLSAPPDTFNNGIDLIILPPDANTVFTTMYKIVRL
ncbi:MAG: aldose 1-epimerase [Bacteroidota bacterium]